MGADPSALVDQWNAWGQRVESALTENRAAIDFVQDALKDAVWQAKAALNEIVGGLRGEMSPLREQAVGEARQQTALLSGVADAVEQCVSGA